MLPNCYRIVTKLLQRYSEKIPFFLFFDERFVLFDERKKIVDERVKIVDERSNIFDERKKIVDEWKKIVDERNISMVKKMGSKLIYDFGIRYRS